VIKLFRPESLAPKSRISKSIGTGNEPEFDFPDTALAETETRSNLHRLTRAISCMLQVIGSISLSRRLCAFSVDVDGVERLARCHEETIFLGTAEAQIGASLREMDLAD